MVSTLGSGDSFTGVLMPSADMAKITSASTTQVIAVQRIIALILSIIRVLVYPFKRPTMPFPQPSRVKHVDHQKEFSLLIVTAS